MAENKNACRVLMGKPVGKRPLRDLGMDGKIILKRILNNGSRVDWINLPQDRDGGGGDFVNMKMGLQVP
jgi:hypothetical protein